MRVHDKLLCTRLQNYMIGASLMSVSVSVLVSVPWNTSLRKVEARLLVLLVESALWRSDSDIAHAVSFPSLY